MSRLRRPGQQQVSPRADRPNPQGPMRPPPPRAPGPSGKAVVGRIIHRPAAEHQCRPGVEWDGQKPQIRPIGTIWECDYCNTQWRMEQGGWRRTAIMRVPR